MPLLTLHWRIKNLVNLSWCRGVVVITTAQLHSTKPELRFCTGSNPARGVSEIRDGEELWQWSGLEIRLNAFRRPTVPQKEFIIIIQSGGILGKTLDNLCKKILLDLAAQLAKKILPKLTTKVTSSVIDKLERKISGKGAVKAKKNSLYSFQIKVLMILLKL